MPDTTQQEAPLTLEDFGSPHGAAFAHSQRVLVALNKVRTAHGLDALDAIPAGNKFCAHTCPVALALSDADRAAGTLHWGGYPAGAYSLVGAAQNRGDIDFWEAGDIEEWITAFDRGEHPDYIATDPDAV